jgi:hypothetical protein
MPISQEALLQAAATITAAKIRNQGEMILGARVANQPFAGEQRTEVDFLAESIDQVVHVLEAIREEQTKVSLAVWNKLG